MAKTKGPLLSLAASGTIAGLVSYRMTNRGAEVTKKPHPKTPASQQQAIERQSMKDARAAFLILDLNDLALWQELADAKQSSAWNQFFREWKIQQVTAGSFPLIPEPNL